MTRTDPFAQYCRCPFLQGIDPKAKCGACIEKLTVVGKLRPVEILVPRNTQSTWDIINEQRERNTGDRVHWKSLLGESLTKKAASLYGKGVSREQAVLTIEQHLKEKGMLTERLQEKIKIGVSARYGEMKSEQRRIQEVQQS